MPNKTTLSLNANELCQGVSVVSVIFGFHDANLKVLLNKFHISDLWMLPDGFVLKNENVDNEAHRILKLRTGIENVYLRQFHTFGDRDRIKIEQNKQLLLDNNIMDEKHWFLQRLIAIAYYSLVEYSKVEIKPDRNREKAQWFNVDEVPELFADHNLIIEKALKTIRQQINYIPIGLELLPDKFVLSDLRIIYETIMNKKLDPRNFQRKIFALNLLHKLNETQKKKGSKDAALYSFDKVTYQEAVNNGISFVNW